MISSERLSYYRQQEVYGKFITNYLLRNVFIYLYNIYIFCLFIYLSIYIFIYLLLLFIYLFIYLLIYY